MFRLKMAIIKWLKATSYKKTVAFAIIIIIIIIIDANLFVVCLSVISN
jgi:t-SNARE complex subunit (syntaxin)